ncbi:peptide ABC transporter substrate-binding protein [Pseudoclavibacter endophyticus]|nr:ABC transporter substrate-binding protein [Pseudoclavibacter endophyticus]GGA63139.1 peptide ABC transporter substrate-binding protein [Pseudoclavibacter endophyticus]
MRRTSKTLGLGLAVTLTLTACGGGGETDAAEGDGPTGTVTFATLFQPSSWDPAIGDFMGNAFYYGLVYDTVVARTAAGELEPGLAESWTYDDDQTTLTLELRQGVAFTDGTPVDADAIVANLEHYRDANGPGTAELALVERIEAVDGDTVEVGFTAPDPSFVEDLSSYIGFVASPAAIESGTLETDPVGSGPYVLDAANSTSGSTWTFNANPETWTEPPYATLVASIMDATAALNALKGGQADLAMLLDLQAAEEAEDSGYDRSLFAPSSLGIAFFDRDGTIAPEVADVRVRQAINHAIDAEALINAFLGGTEVGTPGRQLFGASSDAFDASLDDAYPFDPQRARELLTEAGYPDGFTLTMPYVLIWGPGVPDAIQTQLAEVGITVEYDQLPPEEIGPSINSGKYAAALQSFGLSSSWMTMTQQVDPDGAYNPFSVEDATAMELMTEYQYADEADRPAIGQELNAYMTEQAWSNVWGHGHPSILSDPAKITLPATSVGFPPVFEWVPAGH